MPQESRIHPTHLNKPRFRFYPDQSLSLDDYVRSLSQLYILICSPGYVLHQEGPHQANPGYGVYHTHQKVKYMLQLVHHSQDHIHIHMPL